MATTKTIEITKDWQKVADGDCVVQSLFYADEFCISIGEASDDAYILMKLNDACLIEFGASVYIKLPHSYTGQSEKITLIM